ncbi:uncharacterized protein LOC113309337 [Papaver somniferum]|uniref:uncharacterized protein LOC113309337 n=1 Tax=Papaver somniferum TaxID=3469 RepID=UPI000E6F4747|nr:uncharacterized protein LOC113309337 [Papaver somniferum]
MVLMMVYTRTGVVTSLVAKKDSKLSMASETLHSRFLNATNGSSCSVHSIILSKSQCRGLDMYRYIRDDQFLFRVAIGIRFPVLDSCKLYGISQDELVVQW